MLFQKNIFVIYDHALNFSANEWSIFFSKKVIIRYCIVSSQTYDFLKSV